MKKWISVMATALLAFAFTSCFNQDDNTDFVQEWMCMATVTTGGVNPIFQMDDGQYLTPEKAMPADTFTIGERYYLHFVLGDTLNHPAKTYPVNFFRYGKTAVKNLVELPKDSTDRWGNQPISNLYAWFSGHYFNSFFISYAGAASPNTFELVRIKDDENTTSTDTVPQLYFEFRHNVAYVSFGTAFYRYYSFDLSSLTTEFPAATKFKIQIRWNDMRYESSTFTRYYIPELPISNTNPFSVSRKNPELSPSLF